MHRLLLPTVVCALVVAGGASAKLLPLRPDLREAAQPRVRAGVIAIPAAHRAGVERVIVALAPPPLAAWQAGRRLAAAGAARRLDTHAAASRTYLARLARAQAAAAAALRRAIPAAVVQERYSILLDGFAVQLPAKDLPRLLRVAGVRRVYPSLRYSLTMDRGPSVIHASDLTAATGDGGQGVKIGVVDTGIDSTSPFLSPKGFSYPAGFPKGDTRLTTPKVIVARVFPGPVRDARSNQAFDPTEPHGTHVAGIAAGDAGTAAPKGPDHPAVADLAGVAPKAWLGNYRVFTVPTPLGHEADTPEIVQAFEAAVADGMDVINFSGGGPQTDPANDAMYQTIHNTVLAGVVPVIAAGNDRDDFGLGTTGSPGTAPDAITVAAVSNAHVFAPALAVAGGPPALTDVPLQPTVDGLPTSWSTGGQTLVDVTTVLGSDGKPVDARLCGRPEDPDGTVGTLAADSVTGKVLLVRRGSCSFVSKAARALLGGAAGLLVADNRPGEANPIPVELPVAAAMVSDLDGAALQAYLDAHGGEARFRVSPGIEEIPSNRSGVVTSFSSAGPNDFSGELKPDIAAPGLDVLSSTPPRTTGSTFAVFAGTSMATPHVAGAAALLLQRHPAWTPAQVKSALMTTAGPAWQDTARTKEASVLLEGAGLANVQAADDPKVFADPQSLSFDRIDVSTGAQRRALLLSLFDAGGGAGSWTIAIAPQTQTAGVELDVPGNALLMPGGSVSVPVVVNVAADAGVGENAGFLVLSGNGVQRRVPYAFLVERPALRTVQATPLAKLQVGSTAKGASRVAVYCCPSEPFGPPPDYTGPAMNESGAERLYSIDLDRPVSNFGVSILAESQGALVDPFVLGSKDERDVQGYAGIPTDVNGLTYDYGVDIGAAGVQFPRVQRFYVAVDSRADPFSGRAQNGSYLLNTWVDDVTPPSLRILTTRVTAGRPLIVARAVDNGSGVDPLSLVIGYDHALVGASAYDPESGLALFGLPDAAPKLAAGSTTLTLEASDFQEAKNIETAGDQILPNTAFLRRGLTVVAGPSVTWLEPPQRSCALAHDRLTVAAASTKSVTKVVFSDGAKRIGVDRNGPGGVYSLPWSTAKLKHGPHRLRATVVDAAGRTATAAETVSICR